MTVKDYLIGSNLNKAEIRQILCFVLNMDSAQLLAHSERIITESQIELINKLSEEREQGKPLAYVLESRFFYRNEFFTPQGVLIPQPDTEILVEEAIASANLLPDKKSIHILDMCAGTGCIGISVAKELSKKFDNIYLTLSDISEKAYEVFSKNVSTLITEKNIIVTLNIGNLFENIKSKFNLILSNPPYIKTSVIPTLDSEVQSEPLIALDGGEDGTLLISRIVEESKNYCLENAFLLMEIGYDQGAEVSTLFRMNSLSDIQIIKDLGMRDRVVKGRFNVV